MKRVLLGLGSNRGEKNMPSIEILRKACFELKAILKDPIFSSVYKTKAMYVVDQNDFYNMAALGFVPDDFSPHELLRLVNQIEAKYGRNRSEEIRFGPRSLDIDIELFGNESVNDSVLQIPHPRLKERAFVLIPAIEILTESADELIREEWKSYLDSLYKNGDGKDVRLFLPKSNFI